MDECWEAGSSDGVLDLELGSDVRSVSAMGGCGDLAGREACDESEGERAERFE